MASSSSSSPSAPAFSSRSWKHHVFLSFRGEDTRHNFVGHLYTALEKMGIHTYKDDKKLSLGEAINPSLKEAIEQSQIAIIVFSENYADSSWCLNELTHIMKCRKERGLSVVPIFYGVDPSEVRKQKRKYRKAFAKHQLEKNVNVASWREALVEASGNCGRDFKSGNTDESELIKNIVNKILKMIRPLTPRMKDKLVGMEARMDALISKLQIGLDNVLMIGIWGFGGGGKTILATSVYSKISWEFDGCCCIENIREECKNGIVKLQRKIISGVLKEDKVWVGSIEEGKDMIRDKFSGKKVLIVLDDVDQRDQLEALAGSRDWFAKGSRIIITTRDEHLLKAHKIDVHNICLLDNDEATKLLHKCAGLDNRPMEDLLHKCAGLDNRPMEDYDQLSKEVVSYACGLPLALTVLGSDLYGRDLNEWKSALARLKNIPHDDIVGKLRTSYDRLKKVEQDLFLDIACFFRRENKNKAMRILEACGLYPEIGLKVLKEKALISISDEMFDMHDLVQEMGLHIVRGKHPNNPEKYSRVWKHEDVITICSMDPTTNLDMIEAIRYKWAYGLKWDDSSKNLPPIIANTKNLRWIEWDGDFVSPFITNFPQRNLCCLILMASLQKQLWEGYTFLPNLKIMELDQLHNLTITPNFAGIPNLESFKLRGSRKVQEIHSSFGLLEKLVFLSIELCPGIKICPSLNRLKNLMTLSFKGCPRIFKLSKIQQKMDKLPYDFHLDNSGQIQVKKPQFDLLHVEECCLEEPYSHHSNMKHHTRLWFYRTNLIKLNLSWSDLTDEDVDFSYWELPNLQELDLSSTNFSRLDFSLWVLPRLKWLNVSGCNDLVELSNLPSSIAIVDVTYCKSLEWFGDTSSCKWLWKVSISEGYKLDSFNAERLLRSMLQGNAIEDYFINFTLEHQIPKGFVGRFFKGSTFTSRRHPRYWNSPIKLRLPDDWYNRFSGFLIRFVTVHETKDMLIIIKHEEDGEDTQFEIWKESDDAPEPEYDGIVKTCVGVVSFNSLRHTTSLNSSHNVIILSMMRRWISFALELIPINSIDDVVQTTKEATNCSECFYTEHNWGQSFSIHEHSKSNIKIYWNVR